MCGICGTVAFSSLTSPEAAHLRVTSMLRSLSHRGPDATSQVASEFAVSARRGWPFVVLTISPTNRLRTRRAV